MPLCLYYIILSQDEMAEKELSKAEYLRLPQLCEAQAFRACRCAALSSIRKKRLGKITNLPRRYL